MKPRCITVSPALEGRSLSLFRDQHFFSNKAESPLSASVQQKDAAHHSIDVESESNSMEIDTVATMIADVPNRALDNSAKRNSSENFQVRESLIKRSRHEGFPPAAAIYSRSETLPIEQQNEPHKLLQQNHSRGACILLGYD